MGIISAVRSQLPVPASQPHPASGTSEGASVAQSIAAVAEPLRPDAVRQPDSAPASVGVQLAEVDENREPVVAARAAAEAARDAYIRASIAAGINPLPLP
ncbi:hypothetical protein [Tabrizicola soli]|uniref:Uncharacterized protein n=1 Tax=Tabrizicola soli TaxID=2185115 RepID=A0ABV7DWU7_9RHOB|nr:hypothetical protein [Tabrizicola soli]